jgi:hypothetical protein
MYRLSRLASDDELENIMPCYTRHGMVVRSDGNCREMTRTQLLRFAYRSAHSRSRSPRSLRVECRLDAPRWSDGGHDCAKPFGEVSRHCLVHFILRRLNFTLPSPGYSSLSHPLILSSLNRQKKNSRCSTKKKTSMTYQNEDVSLHCSAL